MLTFFKKGEGRRQEGNEIGEGKRKTARGKHRKETQNMSTPKMNPSM
jgi:hypothetical protein